MFLLVTKLEKQKQNHSWEESLGTVVHSKHTCERGTPFSYEHMSYFQLQCNTHIM